MSHDTLFVRPVGTSITLYRDGVPLATIRVVEVQAGQCLLACEVMAGQSACVVMHKTSELVDEPQNVLGGEG